MGYEAHMDNKRIVFIKLIKNCKPNHSLINKLTSVGGAYYYSVVRSKVGQLLLLHMRSKQPQN